jgi:hypothetical protein
MRSLKRSERFSTERRLTSGGASDGRSPVVSACSADLDDGYDTAR